MAFFAIDFSVILLDNYANQHQAEIQKNPQEKVMKNNGNVGPLPNTGSLFDLSANMLIIPTDLDNLTYPRQLRVEDFSRTYSSKFLVRSFGRQGATSYMDNARLLLARTPENDRIERICTSGPWAKVAFYAGCEGSGIDDRIVKPVAYQAYLTLDYRNIINWHLRRLGESVQAVQWGLERRPGNTTSQLLANFLTSKAKPLDRIKSFAEILKKIEWALGHQVYTY